MTDRPTRPAPIDLSALARQAGRRSRPDSESPYGEICAAYDSHHYDEALMLARALLSARPDDAEARRLVQVCHGALEELRAFAIGSRQQVPVLLIDRAGVAALRLDHRAGFVVSLIDGLTPIDVIADLSPMPAHETIQILFGLLRDGVIAVA